MKTSGEAMWIWRRSSAAALLAVLVCGGRSACRTGKALDRATAEAVPRRADGDADRHGPARCARRQLDEPDRSAGMSGYLLPFEIVSVHLLVVLIGAAYLARAKRSGCRSGWSNDMNVCCLPIC